MLIKGFQAGVKYKCTKHVHARHCSFPIPKHRFFILQTAHAPFIQPSGYATSRTESYPQWGEICHLRKGSSVPSRVKSGILKRLNKAVIQTNKIFPIKRQNSDVMIALHAHCSCITGNQITWKQIKPRIFLFIIVF